MTTRLDEFDFDEWFDVGRKLKPQLTHAEFQKMWDEFHAEKEARLARKELN